jgi:hypothetical protein
VFERPRFTLPSRITLPVPNSLGTEILPEQKITKENKMNITVDLLSAGIGYIAGAFTPSVLRKVKSFFVKETTKLKADAVKAEADVAKKV